MHCPLCSRPLERAGDPDLSTPTFWYCVRDRRHWRHDGLVEHLAAKVVEGSAVIGVERAF